jgi:hypothetical protein
MSGAIPKFTYPQILIGSASCFIAALVFGLLSGGQSQTITPLFGKNKELVSAIDNHSPSTTDKNVAWNFGALQAAMRIMPGHLT